MQPAIEGLSISLMQGCERWAVCSLSAGAAKPLGVKTLHLEDDRDGSRRRKSKDPALDEQSSPTSTSRRKRKADTEYGSALRSAYQRTIDEAIPPEMLDLLGKLG